jgi:hypothetical protein
MVWSSRKKQKSGLGGSIANSYIMKIITLKQQKQEFDRDSCNCSYNRLKGIPVTVTRSA